MWIESFESALGFEGRSSDDQGRRVIFDDAGFSSTLLRQFWVSKEAIEPGASLPGRFWSNVRFLLVCGHKVQFAMWEAKKVNGLDLRTRMEERSHAGELKICGYHCVLHTPVLCVEGCQVFP
jgi:hypothetical protein